MKYWEIIADNLSKAGWSWGCVATVDRDGRITWIADAHRAIYSPATERAYRCPYKTHAGKTRARRIEGRESKASRFTQRITLQDLALKKDFASSRKLRMKCTCRF